jgi:hypothetical protein
MSTDPAQTPAFVLLARAIAKGREFASRENLIRDASSLWIVRTRGALAHIYGKDAPQIDFWCPKSNDEPPGLRPRDRVLFRLPALERLHSILGVQGTGNRIFIGHGHSSEWLKLRVFLQGLGLPCDEFNIEPAAGLQTGSRIEAMLSEARIAFLVLTGEDQHADGTLHARQNVVHEVGLFQAKLGPTRAIVLLEKGCYRFSNLDGLTTIDFPPGDLMARSEEVRGVLRREHVFGASS